MREFVKDRTGFDGRIGTNWLAQLSKSLGLSVEPWVRALQGTQARPRARPACRCRAFSAHLGAGAGPAAHLHARPPAC